MINQVKAAVYGIGQFLTPAFPVYIASTIYKEVDEKMESIFRGAAYMRCSCDVGKGQEFLKEKSFYISNNPWELALNLACSSLITALGIVLAPVLGVWGGYGIAAASSFQALAYARQCHQGNHLEKALSLIVPDKDKLPSVPCTLTWGKIGFDPELLKHKITRGVETTNGQEKTTFLAFHCEEGDEKVIKIYYFGSRFFKEQKMEHEKTKIFTAQILNGSDIPQLLSCPCVD
jgi:hypothetical protein